jgi:predicted O-methyltransferase YrrM
VRYHSLHALEGQFDLIYIDAEEDEYEAYTQLILDHKLLSPRGVLIVDDSMFCMPFLVAIYVYWD